MKLEGKRQLEGLGVEGRIILKWIFEKWDGDMVWLNFTQDRDKL